MTTSASEVKEPVRCNRCIMDETVGGIRFDKDGVCNYCHMHDSMDKLFPIGKAGEKILKDIAVSIRKSGKGKPYDCVVGFSGGRDTSYCLHYAKEVLGLKPLAVHFDNGWTSEKARSNMENICAKLGVDLHIVTMDWDDSRELTNANIRACVPYVDLTNDIGIAYTLYSTAAKNDIKYILLSHSFREEGVAPLLWNYMDARYTRAIIKRFVKTKINHFKNADIHHFLYWLFIKRIKVVNVTNYYNDMGRQIENTLIERYGWQEPDGHHMDNELFILIYNYAWRKFGIDWRVVDVAAQVRTGILTREEGLAIMASPPYFDNEEFVSQSLEKQQMSREEFEAIIAAPNKYFLDYPNYYSWVKLFKWPFKLLCRMHILPIHAYEKYFEAI
jgi:N-acetyl sugar amidotransferase